MTEVRYGATIDEIKRQLLGALQGDVLEIGAGDGANFTYFPKDVRWTGIEPDTNRHNNFKRAALRFGFTPKIVSAKAERLEIADASVDAVISTRVLCSVESQRQVLSETLRVLKKGGRYVFIEHVGAPPHTFKRRIQDLLQPVWGTVTDGCHLNRDTEAAIRSAGFSQVDIQPMRLAIGILLPHIAGIAIK